MKLVKLEQAVKVLEKHKEKQREAYLEEEKAQELRQFSEIGVQRFFIQAREKEEDEEELRRIINETTKVSYEFLGSLGTSTNGFSSLVSIVSTP